jgi:hypothetical protein
MSSRHRGHGHGAQAGRHGHRLFRPADMDDTEIGSSGKESNDAAQTAKERLDALMCEEQEVFAASLSTKAAGVMVRFVPDSANAAMHEKMAKRGSTK